MKKLFLSITLTLLFSGSLYAATYAVYTGYTRPAPTAPGKLCVSSATTSNCSVDAFVPTYFEPRFVGQKVCLALLDTDGVGFTYITANNGALTLSTVGCQ